MAHFGLGEEERVDLRIVYPHGKGTIEQKDVAPNQRLMIKGTDIKASGGR
jgi:hypothetical protein